MIQPLYLREKIDDVLYFSCMHHHLNLRDVVEIVDFMAAYVEYLPINERKPFEKLVADVDAHKVVASEVLVEHVRELGMKTWPARRALSLYVETEEGAKQEWEELLATVRPSTALLLKRLRKNPGIVTVDQALNHSDSAFAIHDEQEVELQMVRPQVCLKLWQDHQEDLRSGVTIAKGELMELRKRLKKLAELAMEKTGLEDELLSKVGHYEDRIFYGGEMIPLEVLDKEVGFDVEDVEVGTGA